MGNINKLIDEVIEGLAVGVVDSEIKFRMKINPKTSNHFEITPTLNIKDKDKFYKCINEYVSLFLDDTNYILADSKDDHIKRIIALMFANMSIDDFNNPCEYVRRIIDFKKDTTLQNREFEVPTLDSDLHINIRKYNVETPYCFECRLVGDEEYLLPIVSYGISNDTCYIYAIQDFNEHESTPYHNKIKKMLYRLNKGVLESETKDYIEYKNGSSYFYQENISDVSPGAVLSLTIFLNEIQKYGINKVKVIPYLPVRYENKIKVLAVKAFKKAKKEGMTSIQRKEHYLKLINQQKYYQSNMTEKFIRTFYRVSHHFNNVNITSLPMELDDGLHIRLDKFKHSDNEILNDVINNSNNKTL